MRRHYRRWLGVSVLLVGLIAFSPQISSAIDTKQLKALLQQAEIFEHSAQWHKACEIYEAILRNDRNTPGVQAKYQHGLRRFWQSLRHGDINYRKEVLSLKHAEALKLYAMIRDTLLDNSLEKRKVDPARLFHKGLEELDHALADPSFCQQYLPNIKGAAIGNFREFMKKTWGSANPASRTEAVNHLRDVAIAAQGTLQLSSTVTIMEFACGACYALDEYTLYLTPRQLRELCDSLRGEVAGVGLTFRNQEGKLLIAEIAPESAAARFDKPPLVPGDQVLSIDKKPATMLSVEAAHEMLVGPLGSTVELEIYKAGMAMHYPVSLSRRSPSMPSVQASIMEGIAYLQISGFQDTTVQEVDNAIAGFGKAKALILDLRGNGGGLFEPAIDVARRFLANGIIASTENTDPKLNTVYHSRNPNALTLPVVVLIDGDTASASEVLVGALKDHKRATLVGQTTFGKGCTQCILKLPAAKGNVPTGGLRLTVARFFSPDGLPYTGRGVSPDHFASGDQQFIVALAEARRLVEKLDE